MADEKDKKDQNSQSNDTKSDNAPKRAVIEQAKKDLEVMDRSKCDRIFKNKKGEYFTSHNLAVLSENGDVKNVSEINRNVIELIVNGK